MKRRSFLLAAALLLALQVAAPGQVKLERKFTEGAKVTANTYIKVDQTLSIGGNEIPTSSEQNITIGIINGKRQDDGTLSQKHEIKSLQATLVVAGMKLTFDSVNPDAPASGTQLDALLDVFKAVSRSSWTVIYGADNKAVAVKGRDDALKDLPQELRAAMERQFEGEHLTQQTNQELRVLPDRAVKPGDSWEREETVMFDSYQSMDFTTIYTYEGTIEKDGKSLDKITSKTTTVTYNMADDSPSPLKIVGSELEVADSGGTILFDRQAGLVVQTKDKKHITGSLECEVGGNGLDGKLDLVFETSTRRE